MNSLENMISSLSANIIPPEINSLQDLVLPNQVCYVLSTLGLDLVVSQIQLLETSVMVKRPTDSLDGIVTGTDVIPIHRQFLY